MKKMLANVLSARPTLSTSVQRGATGLFNCYLQTLRFQAGVRFVPPLPHLCLSAQTLT